MAAPVRVISGWTIGGGGKARELFDLPPWLILTGRGIRWLTLHPGLTGAVAVTAWLAGTGAPVPLAAATGGLVPLGLFGGKLALVARRAEPGAALRDILVGLSRRRKLLRLWSLCAEAGGFGGRAGRGAPRLAGIRVLAGGDLTARVLAGTVGRVADDVAAGANGISAVLGCRTTRVHERSPGIAQISVHWGDPLSQTLHLVQLPTPPPGQIPYGITEDNGPATLSHERSLLVVGEPGAGKSSLIWAALAGARLAGIPVRLRVIDPAGGVELADLGAAIRRQTVSSGDKEKTICLGCAEQLPFHVHDYTDRASEAKALVQRTHDAMEVRLRQMTGRRHRPSVAEPLDILLIDELLLLDEQIKQGARSKLGEILSVGRKANFVVWACSQLPQKETVGTIRDLFPQRVALRVKTREMVDAALGFQAASSGARADRISDRTPGVGYSYSDDQRGFRRFRAVYVSDTETALIARGELPPALTLRQDVALENQQHVLYAWYDAGDRLLYVGISNNGRRRADEHLANKDWAAQAVRMEILGRFSSRAEALAAEKRAIRELGPIHNVVHNRGRRRTPR